MQSFIANIANLVTDAPSQGTQRETNRSDDRDNSGRDDFANLVDRASNTDSRNSLAARDRDNVRDAADKDAYDAARRADDNRGSDDKRADNSKDNSKDDYSKQDAPKTDSRRSDDNKADDSKSAGHKVNDKSAADKADNNNANNDDKADDTDGDKKSDAKTAFLLQANELIDSGGVVSDDAAQPSVGGGVTPDVTAILTDAPPVQTAGDSNIITAPAQPMGLLGLAALLEKASAAVDKQKTAKAVVATNMTILSAPIAPVVTEDTTTNAQTDVTPLVDVLGQQQAELPGQVKAQTVQLDAPVKDSSKIDNILNAVKQAVQPVADATQPMQLKVSAEEVIDPADALAKVTADPEVSKVVQKFLEGAQGDGKKSTNELVASLKEVLSQRADKDNVLPLGQAVSQAVHASLDLTLSHDDTSLLGQGANSQVMSQLAADALRHANAANMKNDSSFLGMLDKTTNHVPVADQVMVNIKQAVADGASHIKIQLHPEDLGRVDVRMSVGVDGKTSMTIVADNRDTLDMLQREARNLERSLTDCGLKPDTGGLSFHLRQQGQDQQQKFTKTGTGYAAVAEVEADEPAAMTNMAAYRMTVSEGVDIRV